MPAQVRVSLETLIQRITAKQEVIACKITDLVTDAIEMGEMLLDAKSMVPHGQFGAWIARNCPFSWQCANRYMRVAKAKLNGPVQFDGAQSITACLRMLTDESAHEEETPAPKLVNGTHMPLNGQTTFLADEDETLDEQLEELFALDGTVPDSPRERERKPLPDETRSFENWEAFIVDLNNQVCWIDNHGGFDGYTQGWSEEQRTCMKENLRRFQAHFTRWIKQLEGVPL